MDKYKTVGFQVRRLSNAVGRYIETFHLNDNECQKATRVQGWIIDYIYDNRGKDIFQKDLENEFAIRRSTVTEMLQLMEKNGLIIRESVPYDARLKKLAITDKALSEYKRRKEIIQHIEGTMTEGIDKEKLDIFFEVSNSIMSNIEIRSQGGK